MRIIINSLCKRVLIIIWCIPLFQHVRAQTVPDSVSKILIAKEKEMFNVITGDDRVAAGKLLADDYFTINADGVTEDKEATIKTIGKFKGSVAELSDKKLREYDHVALINGKVLCKVHPGIRSFLYRNMG